jgi:hypothetical protein
MALDGYQISSLVIGLSPFIVLGLVALVIAGGWLYVQLKDDLAEMGITAIVIFCVVLIVMLIVGTTCMSIRPRELFVDGSGAVTDVSANADTLDALTSRVEALEKDACELVTRTDQFIQNDVGKPGQDDPSLVAAAQQKARDDLPGGIIVCPVTASPIQGLSAEILADLENRVTRLETTVLKFTLPEIQKTYDTATTCEGFEDVPVEDPMKVLADRIGALEASADLQKSKMLKAIDDKTAALQRGELSDCDKKRGGDTAIATSTKMPAGSVSGV